MDVSTYREVPNALSLFARNSKRDFMGVYYEKSDWGIVHVADHGEVPGKKTGPGATTTPAKSGSRNSPRQDGQYVEFQAGRYETQMEHQFLAPHRVEHFVEHWYPVNGLGGGFSEATADAALRVKRDGSQIQISGNVNASFEDAELKVETEGQGIATRRLNLKPADAISRLLSDLPPAMRHSPLIDRQDRAGVDSLSHRHSDWTEIPNSVRPPARSRPDGLRKRGASLRNRAGG